MRHIEIEFIYNTDLENKVEDFMKRADLLPLSSKIGITRKATIKTENPLPLVKYRQVIEKAFKENGGALLEMKEVAPTELESKGKE